MHTQYSGGAITTSLNSQLSCRKNCFAWFRECLENQIRLMFQFKQRWVQSDTFMYEQERTESPHLMMTLPMKSGRTSNFWSVVPLHDGLLGNMAKHCRFLFSTICVQEQTLIFLWCLILLEILLEILLYFDIELSVCGSTCRANMA